ncbi:hypothetical protein MUN81_10305 [Hymenobacter sp. 5317J-9]|uniref:hypothetical protein n=1 Tax=Hymenobacter sp. 5317J-9 TaxID=2932250 RepID=UPI001FD701A9|nr:hypothetical protein [Hymenobacter sp. 5317J-9]UOQ99870.1 hypothetical protein MUN81_10305 [Hymenobacter sp. 5317J-9]
MPRNTTQKLEVDLTLIGVDEENPRLAKQLSQPAAIMAMVENQKGKIVNLAEDIEENGLSDAERFIVMKATGQPYSYITLDGNRRLVALKLLENPALAGSHLSGKLMERLRTASHKFKANPIARAEIAVYANRTEAAPWLEKRHSIEMKGVGQERWNPIEIRRFLTRLDEEGRPVKKSAELQILDFVLKHGSLTQAEHEQVSKRKFPITTLKRIIVDSYVREVVGYTIESNVVFTDLPDDEIVKPFKKMVLDLTLPDKDERIKVTDLEESPDRAEYIDGFPFYHMPSSSAKQVKTHMLGEPNEALPESETTKKEDEKEKDGKGKSGTDDKKKEGESKPEKKSRKPRTPRKKTTNQRVCIIPEDCHLTISSQRIHDIYHELQVDLDSNQCTNACAVLMRVFIELSLDSYIDANGITPKKSKSNSTMSDKLHAVGAYVVASGLMEKSDAEPIYAAAKTDALLAPTVLQMHTYVHREKSTPVASDLRKQWNNLQPLMEIIWA